VLHEVKVEVVVEVVQVTGIGLVQAADIEEGRATAEVVRLEGSWAGSETIAACYDHGLWGGSPRDATSQD
jgi:hypothetical protein